MTVNEIYAHIACAIEDQGSKANMYIPGVGCVLKDGEIQRDVIAEFERQYEEYKLQQELRK